MKGTPKHLEYGRSFPGSLEVLVTGGTSRAGLAVARSLVRQGVSLLAVGEEPQSLTFHSRYARNVLLSPSPTEQPEDYFEFILTVVKKYKIQLVIPLFDVTLLIFDRHREELEKHTKLAMASSQSLRHVLDKRMNLQLAKQLGIPCPKQHEIENIKQIPDLIAFLGFPIVLKPPGSSHNPALPSFPFKVLYAHDEPHLRNYILKYCREGDFPLFQEYVKGTVHNLCCFATKGDTIAIHQYHSLRRFHGNGVLRKIVEPLPEAAQAAREMLRALEWDGVAHVAFIVDQRSKQLRYMETNGRLWSSVEGSIHAGWDFPYWVYEYFRYGNKPEPGPIRLGSQTCWHRGDLAALSIYLAGGEVPATGTTPSKLRSIVQYLSGFNPMIHSDVFRWNDPVPEFIDHWHLV